MSLETSRLVLRPWEASDEPAIAQMGADPQVMRYFSALQSASEAREMLHKMQAHYAQYGYGIFALNRKDDGEFLGMCGIFHPDHGGPYTPCFEIGWRLRPNAWGKGFATESARKFLEVAFEKGAPSVVAVTVPVNTPSRRVMERLGMTHYPQEEFDHPRVPEGHVFRRHVLYRISREEFFNPKSDAALRG